MADSGMSESERHRLLLEKYTELASLAGGLAHEIKNPLSTLSLNLQLLAEDFGQPESQRERRALQKIETLQRECKRLETILDDFLRFARVSDLAFEPTSVNRIVEEVIEFFAPQVTQSNAVLRTDLRPDLPPVRIDRDSFKQALLNLLLNGLQAMTGGGELIVRTRAEQGRVCVDVIDTGPGIPADAADKIFKPFFSTRKGGSGLGLPTTRRIIEAHQGELAVASEPGKGTSFTIRLPAAESAP